MARGRSGAVRLIIGLDLVRPKTDGVSGGMGIRTSKRSAAEVSNPRKRTQGGHANGPQGARGAETLPGSLREGSSRTSEGVQARVMGAVARSAARLGCTRGHTRARGGESPAPG